MIILLLALIGALLVMAILTIGRLAFGRREPFIARKFVRWFTAYFIFNYLFCLLILYVSEPALTGPFGGWQWILFPLVVSSIGNLFALARPMLGTLEDVAAASQGRRSTRSGPLSLPTEASRGAIAAGIFGLAVAATIGIVVAGLIVVFTTWFDSNAKALAESINRHLYYVAPLTYNNIFINLSNSSTPGFVVVDAEDPNAQPTLHTGSSDSIAYLPGAILNQDLIRHVYLSGYTYGRLVDPTLELDDTFHPYWTISLMQPTRGYTGDVLSQVLIVDAHTGIIKVYQPKNVPLWVDRVMPSDTVTQYLTWWGLYHAAPWFNPSGAGQQAPVVPPQLLYNDVDQPVWLIPMTSSSANDKSSTGVFLFDTHKNDAHFYPKAAGIGIGSNVQNTFQSTRANILRYSVDTYQLYQICGQPTWVAIYSSASIFQDVGILDANYLNGSNVQFETTLSRALDDYKLWLSQQSIPNDCASTAGGGTQQTVTGKVSRISLVQQNGNTIYYLLISGQNFIFTANLSLSPKLPLVQRGDTVTGTYLKTTGQTGQTIDLKTFDDLSITLGVTPTPTPGAGTPVATPTVSPTP